MSNDQTGAVAEKSKTGIIAFITETRREIAKVTWPTRKEVGVTTILIVVFALITGVFFLMIDSALGAIVSRILGMNG